MTNLNNDAIILSWCATQMQNWVGCQLKRDEVTNIFLEANREIPSFRLYMIKEKTVKVFDKPHYDYLEDYHTYAFNIRAESYTKFFREVAEIHPFSEEIVFLLNVDDHQISYKNLPIFSFQKKLEENYILLPDIDSISMNFYSQSVYHDSIKYSDKAVFASFVGSTTDSAHTVESVRQLSSPRLNAGVYFRDKPEVDFRLPNITQHRDADAESAIRALGFGQGAASWLEQFSARFLLSMDGNGATCSRVSISLASNSVLMKYDSLSQIYYFSSLIPWLHYIPISCHENVIKIVRDEKKCPGKYSYIVEAANAFSRRYLTRDAAVQYTATLLKQYNQIFIQKYHSLVEGIPLQSDSYIYYYTAHIANIGDVHGAGSEAWIGHVNSRAPLEAFALSVRDTNSNLYPFQYQIRFNGQLSDWHKSGETVGAGGMFGRITSIAIKIDRLRGFIFSVRLCVRFIDGTERSASAVDGPVEISESTPIESFRLTLKRIVADGRSG